MEKNEAWHADERHREQLAILVRDDLLSLSRFLIQTAKTRAEKETLRSSPPSSPPRPPSSPPRPPSSPPRPQTTPDASSLDMSLPTPVKRVAIESSENISLAKQIVSHVLLYLDSSDTRYAVAERLIEIEDDAEQLLLASLAAEHTNARASFISKAVTKKQQKAARNRLHEFIRNISDKDEDNFLQHQGIFTTQDISNFFHAPTPTTQPPPPDDPFILKMASLVSNQAEPEEAIVDVLDKVQMLLQAKICAFPPHLTQSPKKHEFATFLNNKASSNTATDVVQLFDKARDSSRPYTAGPLKSMRALFNTDQFVLSAAKGDHKTLRTMLQNGQDVDDFSSTFRYGALHAAADFGMPKCIDVLLTHGATVNIRNKMTGKTPLHYAAESRRFAICQMLLDAGASKRTRDMNGQKALYYGTEVQEPESLLKARVLRDAPGRIMHVNVEGTLSIKQLSEITIDWSTPKNLGYQADEIDHHRILWRAIRPRAVNPLYLKFLKLLSSPDTPAPHDPAEHDWVDEDSGDKPYIIKDLKPAEDYEISVRAHSAGGYGPESHEVTHTAASSVASKAGTPVFMTSTSTSITVAWLPPKYENGEPIKSYQVSRQLIIGKDNKHEHEHEDGEHEHEHEQQWVAVQSMGDRPVATIRSIPEGGFVQVKVRARNENGFSIMGDVGGPFQALDPVRVLDRSPFNMKIIWQTVPAKQVLHFELQIRKYGLILSEDDYSIVADDVPQNINGITYNVLDLLPGTEYQFRIRAFIENEGWQNWPDGLVSNVFRTIDTEPDPPSQPYDKIGASSATSIVLKWEAGPSNGKAIGCFEVYWKTVVKDWELLSEVKGPPTLLVANLEVGNSYFFKVKAHNEVGWSPFSLESKAVLTNPIPIPGVPMQKAAGIGWVQLEWAKPVGELLVDSYEVQKRILSTDQLDHAKWEIVVTTCQATGFLVQELKPCAKYQFRVRALTFDGWSSFSLISRECECKRRH